MKRLIVITILSVMLLTVIAQVTRSEITVFTNKNTKGTTQQAPAEQPQDNANTTAPTDNSTESLAEKVKTSLQTSAKIYAANEQKFPKKFSDYVVPDGEATKPYTFSMKELNKILIKPVTEKDLATTSLTLIYKTGVKARYDLYYSKSDISVEITMLK